MARADEQVQVEHRPGQAIKLTRREAEAFLRTHPGSRIVGAAPAEPPPAEEPEPEADVKAEAEPPATKMIDRAENKMADRPKTKERD